MLEIEIKLYLETEKAAREVCRKLNLPWHDGTFEVNRVFDFPDLRLSKRGALVRLRERGDSGFLTYKEKSDRPVPQAKVRLEYDSEVGRPDAVRKLLDGLGMVQTLAYERFRARHQVADTHVEIDHLPGGWFCEIEGDPDNILKVRRKAGLETADQIVWSYPEIFLGLRKQFPQLGDEWSFASHEAGTFQLPPEGDAFWVAARSES